MRCRILLAVILASLIACSITGAPAQSVRLAQGKKMKIYISADMEGVVGVVTNEQLGPQGFE